MRLNFHRLTLLTLAALALVPGLAGCGPASAPLMTPSPTAITSIKPPRPTPGGPFDDVSPTPGAPPPTPELVSCAEATLPTGSILPPFTPGSPCQLENTSVHVACYQPEATPYQSCGHEENVRETAVADGAHTRIIQRDYHFSAGCFHGISSQASALKVCSKDTGEVTMLAEDLLGAPIPSPDGAWLTFVAAEPGSYRMRPHLYRVRVDGTGLQRLDIGDFPFRVVGISMTGWSADSQWLEVSLWDGAEGGHHAARIRADGSGDYEELPWR